MKLMRFEVANETHAGVIHDGAVAPVPEINARRGTRIPDDVLGIMSWGRCGIFAV